MPEQLFFRMKLQARNSCNYTEPPSPRFPSSSAYPDPFWQASNPKMVMTLH